MNIHVNDALAKRLNDLAAASGRKADDIAQDALVGYLDEVSELRQRLDARYDDLASGRVTPVSAEEAKAHFAEKSRQGRATRE